MTRMAILSLGGPDYGSKYKVKESLMLIEYYWEGEIHVCIKFK